MNFGTHEQKEFFLPKILAGEIHFCIGYTEPESGTDLASLQTRAVRDGDEYVINGAEDLHRRWPATPTTSGWPPAPTPSVAKHKGISMFIVPMDTPGIKVVPMHLLGDHNINYTFYEDVRVPATNLVGGENKGWSLITNQLNHERVTLCSPGIIERALADVRAWAQDTKLRRRAPGHRPGVGAGPPGPGLRQARVPPAHQLEGGLDGHPGTPRRGRRLDHQGLRHRVLHGGLPLAAGGGRPGRLPDPGLARRRCWPGGSRCTPAAWSSSPSAAAPTRSSAT